MAITAVATLPTRFGLTALPRGRIAYKAQLETCIAKINKDTGVRILRWSSIRAKIHRQLHVNSPAEWIAL